MGTLRGADDRPAGKGLSKPLHRPRLAARLARGVAADRADEEVNDIDQIVGIGTFCAVLVLLRVPAVQRALVLRARRLGQWLVEQLEPTETIDPAVEELRRVMRHEWLQAQRGRLQRLLLVDESMSATRQFGNRLAYAWVLAELERARPDPDQLPHESMARPVEPIDVFGGRSYERPTPVVEVLDVGGWRAGWTRTPART